MRSRFGVMSLGLCITLLLTVTSASGHVAESESEGAWIRLMEEHAACPVEGYAAFLEEHPLSREASVAIAQILDAARYLPIDVMVRPLDVVGKTLELNPIRPFWHVDAARAEVFGRQHQDIWELQFNEREARRRAVHRCSAAQIPIPITPREARLHYVRTLERLSEQLPNDDVYIRGEIEDLTNPTLLESVPWAELPVVADYDLLFLEAALPHTFAEPTRAQVLRAIGQTYEELGMLGEARLAYEEYVRTYMPNWDSVEIAEKLNQPTWRRVS